MKRIPTLGVDVGGVIIDKANDKTDTSFFGEKFLETTPTHGVFDALRELHTIFNGRVYVVSKCGSKIEAKTRSWMAHHGFYAKTGIPADHLHFCRERRDKAPICQRLGITHFVDDKLEVLGYLSTVPYRYLFFPEGREVARYAYLLDMVYRWADGWHDVVADIPA